MIKQIKHARAQIVNALLAIIEDEIIAEGELLDFVECIVYETSMTHANGNQTKAADFLGVAKGTLRNKLLKYFGTTLVGGKYHPEITMFDEKYHIIKRGKVDCVTKTSKSSY
ncbi:MAG: hypothetical protein HRT87_01615 [Legionellales bacterium]|nr:hypothetical protein [Legionellales bacterium]